MASSPVPSFSFVVGFLLAVAIILLAFINFSSRRNRGLPPGPPGDPIFGHARLLAVSEPWKLYREWGTTYGDIIYTYIFQRPMIIINKYSDAAELMDKRGAIYSDRPRMVLIEELMKLRSITFLSYGDLWKQYRRLIQQFFNPRAVTAFYPQQEHEARLLVENVISDPDNLIKYVKRFTASTIMSVTYGHQVVADDDPYMANFRRTTGVLFGRGPAGGTSVDFFPILKWNIFPGTFNWRSFAAKGRVALQVMMDQPFEMVRAQMAESKAPPSLTSQLLSDYDQRGSTNPEGLGLIKGVGGSLYRAAAVTTEAVIKTFILGMIRNPSIAKKAQLELDNVIGKGRLPELRDRASTPYLEAIMKESLRMAAPFPLGIAHRVMETDNFNGKVIPKGSLIVPNIWLMMHDSQNYTDPEEFVPERFLNSDVAPLEPAAAVFGFGRLLVDKTTCFLSHCNSHSTSICPGRYFAEANIWLAMTYLLSSFDILPALDVEGKEVMPNVGYALHGGGRPTEFTCRVRRRESCNDDAQGDRES